MASESPTEREHLETSAKPWFLAVNLVNPHDAMWFDPAPSDKGHAGLLPTRGASNDKLYETPWRNVPLPPSRKQPLNGQGRPAAHAMYGAAHAALIGRFDFSDRSVGLYQDNYLNCIRDCDRHVARILEELDNLGIADQTVVILTSDHGELGGYHQMIDKGRTPTANKTMCHSSSRTRHTKVGNNARPSHRTST